MALIKLYANLRKLAGAKELFITGTTVGSVLNELIKRNPPLGNVIFENGELRPHIVVTLNGINVTDLNLAVVEQDVLAIFPPIAGGEGEQNGWLV